MKAIYITEPGKVEIRDIPKPERKPGEALLKVLYGGICGSDLGSYRGTFAYFERRLRSGSVRNVKATNGLLTFEQKVKDRNDYSEGDGQWQG